MICPNCGAKYVDEIKECSACNILLIPNTEKLRKENEETLIDDWVEIFSSADPIEIEMVKANLEGAEINAVVFSKEDRMRLNLSYVGSAPIKLFVKKHDIETAKQIIEDINSKDINSEE